MKRSFLLIEIVVALIIISIIYSQFFVKNSNEKLDLFVEKLELYLNFLRYKALIDDKRDFENQFWHKQRWSIKFLRCRENEGGGIYMSIYSDNNALGHTNFEEALKDPLTNRLITSSNFCRSNPNNSPFSILRNYDIQNVELSCNSTSSLGQISFGEDGKIYSRLSNLENDYFSYEITKACKIKFTTKENYEREIEIYPKTGFINLINKN
ncbi:type II secretion system protein [Arcobacter porcinus]|uniref:Type II secretion system protein n=1 Tax=Arcobacter porcinus TaxID=1935204 RepID=A0A1C0B188_9BACT|nr:type II secretion system protein [Arcobacter porcinus]OCL89578.1 hypothetical protein AAX27_01853 [Aliarcobacter thereius]OCL82901.1 hypothetical protein AAW30_00962 [Arcobacter porcinus]OCL84470.1 hypothetical protein AAW29_00143 [Arcobacter porcinus]OCL89011.1 hypothetical protein AAX30_00143 [Arcobacter porcinus]OCL93547.1 hypothetical protein AAX28_01090 [Arcobacter porcinus]